jgi:fumarate hydratase, class II
MGRSARSKSLRWGGNRRDTASLERMVRTRRMGKADARILGDACLKFRDYGIEGITLDRSRIDKFVGESLMLVTALSLVLGYDKASKIVHYAMDNDLTLKVAALKLGFVTEEEFDRVVDPAKMVKPYVAAAK